MAAGRSEGGRAKVVVLGTGFAALSFMRLLDKRAYDLVVVSPRNHFLFSPLLPSTTVGTIEFRSIIEPIRTALKSGTFTYYQAQAEGIDTTTRLLTCRGVHDGESFLLSYNHLVIAVGAVSATFGVPGVEEHALLLKELADARRIRQRIIECFERAATPLQPEEERRRLLHFVVVGGGPTGVEFAAELHDFLEDDLSAVYPDLIGEARITVVDASKSLLNTFDARLGSYTLQHFRRRRIEVLTERLVREVRADAVALADGTVLSSGLVVWSTGNGPTPLVRALPYPKDRGQRLLTDEYFRVDGPGGLYAIGDCATRTGDALPATAQVAQQEGEYLARQFNLLARGRPLRAFRYRHMGMLAYVGDHRALADLPRYKGKGFTTWLFWRSAYVTKLVSLKNKALVVFDWAKTLFFGRDTSRF